MKKTYRFLLTGDSCSAGQWDMKLLDREGAKATSITSWLTKMGHTCIYHPNPGWGDANSIDKLIEYKNQYDFAIFFKTCASREFRGLEKKKNIEWFAEKDIFKKLDLVNNAIYDYLYEYRDKLILIGGLERIRKDFISFITIDSLAEWLDPTFTDPPYFGDVTHIFNNTDRHTTGFDKLNEMFKIKVDHMKANPQHYYPDGVHPNKIVHEYLAVAINEMIQQ